MGNIWKSLRSPAVWFYNSHDNLLRASTDIKLTFFFFFENMHLTGAPPATKIQTLLSVNFKTNLSKQARCLDKHILPKSMDKKHRQCQEERAASRLGGIHRKNGGRCNQDENFMEDGQKVFLYVTMETVALVPRGRTLLRAAFEEFAVNMTFTKWTPFTDVAYSCQLIIILSETFVFS